MKKAFYFGVLSLILLLLLFFDRAKQRDNAPGKYAEFLQLISDHHPQPPGGEKMVFSSIHGLMRRLDPHSRFLDPQTLRVMLEEQRGSYFGIGIKISLFEDRMTIISIKAGMPAAEAGLLVGDIIIAVDDQPTRNMTLPRAVSLMRGEKEFPLKLRVSRPGITDELSFNLKRMPVPFNSLNHGFLCGANRDIAYISLQNFSRTTVEEFQSRFDELIGQGARSLVLDLRGNPGGSMEAAVALADLFLESGREIVSVGGRNYSRARHAETDDLYKGIPLVVLINRGSASASEIVAAALQEHERALIVGRRSWGKGFVESIFNLPLDSALALTTARYFTPAGSSLQRDYQNVDEYFFFSDLEEYDTDNSMQGGVIPDLVVHAERLPVGLIDIISRGIIFSFAFSFLRDNPVTDNSFIAGEEVLAVFLRHATEIDLDQAAFDQPVCRNRLKDLLTREILFLSFGEEKAKKFELERDPQVLKAFEILSGRLEAVA